MANTQKHIDDRVPLKPLKPFTYVGDWNARLSLVAVLSHPICLHILH